MNYILTLCLRIIINHTYSLQFWNRIENGWIKNLYGRFTENSKLMFHLKTENFQQHCWIDNKEQHIIMLTTTRWRKRAWCMWYSALCTIHWIFSPFAIYTHLISIHVSALARMPYPFPYARIGIAVFRNLETLRFSKFARKMWEQCTYGYVVCHIPYVSFCTWIFQLVETIDRFKEVACMRTFGIVSLFYLIFCLFLEFVLWWQALFDSSDENVCTIREKMEILKPANYLFTSARFSFQLHRNRLIGNSIW